MKIQKKLTVCFLLVSLLTIVVGLVAHWQLTRIANPLRGDISISVEQLGRVLAISDRAQQVLYANEIRFQSIRNYAFTGERRYTEQYHLRRAELTEMLRQLSHGDHPQGALLSHGLPPSQGTLPFPSEIFQVDLSLAAIEQEVIQGVGRGLRFKAVSILESPAYQNLQGRSEKILRDYFDRIGVSYEKPNESALVNVKLATERTDKIIRDGIRWNLVMVLTLIGIAVGISVLIGRSIAAPILRLTATVAGIPAELSMGKFQGDNPPGPPYQGGASPISSKDEIGDLTRAFSRMTKDLQITIAALESSNKELDAFTYTVSHDLRAPLRAISSFATFLEEDCKDSLGAVGQDHLSEIKKGAFRMTRLLDDLLTLSRVSRIQNPYEEVDMNQVVERAKNNVAADFPETDAAFCIEGNLPTVYCDRIKLEV